MELVNYLSNNLHKLLILLPRIAGLFIFMPGLSSRSITTKIKVLLAITISILIASYIDIPIIDDIYILVLRMLAEFLGGFIIGYTASLFMQTIRVVGGIVDNLLGTGIFVSADTSGTMSSVSVKLIEYAALLLFFISNAHLYVFHIISIDLDFMKLYQAFANENFIMFIINTIEFIFINGLHLAMPFVIIFLLIDICLGIMNRSFQSFNVFFFSMPIKFSVFIIFLFYYIYFFKENFSNLMAINFDLIEVFLQLLISK